MFGEREDKRDGVRCRERENGGGKGRWEDEKTDQDQWIHHNDVY
jgi:hypothetical protein